MQAERVQPNDGKDKRKRLENLAAIDKRTDMKYIEIFIVLYLIVCNYLPE